MKNIYLIPTDKPSRLWTNNLRRRLELDEFPEQHPNNIAKHIYITSDEEIKEGDWTLMFDDFGNLFLCDKPQQYLGIEKGHHLNKGLRKIILTTDQDLDEVQAIDDEFLEWFVKNPSCKEVEVESMVNMIQFTPREFIYKIIIPQEESFEMYKHLYGKSVEMNDRFESKHIWSEELALKNKGRWIPKEEPKQEARVFGGKDDKTFWIDKPVQKGHPDYKETIEEAAEDFYEENAHDITFLKLVEFGAKWQAKRMYSEEDLREAFKGGGKMSWTDINQETQEPYYYDFNEWFEQFKKK
jgi:hypothetical protein